MTLRDIARITRRAIGFARRALTVIVLTMVFGLSASAAEDYLDPALAFVPTAAMSSPLELDLHYRIAPAYYMYRERFEVQIHTESGARLLYLPSALSLEPGTDAPSYASGPLPTWQRAPILPKGIVKYDPTFERNMEVYHRQVTLRVPLEAVNQTLNVTVVGQGCADAGLCYPPMTQTLRLVPVDGGYQAVGDQVVASVPPPTDEVQQATEPTVSDTLLNLGDTGMAEWLSQASIWQIVLLSLAFGALLSFTPCVLPMVPILLAIIAGEHRVRGGGASRLRGFGLAVIFVLGMSLVYTVLGVAAGLLGAGLAAWLQSPWVLGSFAILLALFALAMFDVFTFQVPSGMQSALQNRLAKVPGGHASGVFVMGMLSALIVGPCVAAPLAGVLLFISQTGDTVIGGLSLFAMAWGEGLLLLAVGATSGVLLPKAGPWMSRIKAAFGLMLLATAWWMARPLLVDGLYVLGWVFFALWTAIWLGGGGRHPAASVNEAAEGVQDRPLFLVWRTLAAILVLWAVAQFAGLLAGGSDMLRPLAPFTVSASNVTGVSGSGSGVAVDTAAIRARFTRVNSIAELDATLAQTNRAVMLDFYADWCVSCLEMEKFTFSNAQVAQQMSGMLLLQADVTRMSDEDRALLKRFDLFGPPGIIFFGRNGQVRPDARVVGFMKAADFSKVLDRVLGAG
ncbi:protein-disulfide reductase DsbD [Alcaligenaceae bacterium CGII-47]|nr:protein-disulfide reductase DsbD [Alcaligenaceae bacterium CGII-47]